MAPAASDGNQLNFKVQQTNTARIPSDIALLQTVLVVMGAVSYTNPDLGLEWLRDFPLAVSHVLALHRGDIATDYAQAVLDVLLQGLRGPGPVPRASLDLALMTSHVTFHAPKDGQRTAPRSKSKAGDCLKWMRGLPCHQDPCPYEHDPGKRNKAKRAGPTGPRPKKKRQRTAAPQDSAAQPDQ